MRTTATFDHARQQWCVQLVELGPQPILFYCVSEARAKQLSGAINSGRSLNIGTNKLANQKDVATPEHRYENRVPMQRDIATLGGDPTL